MVWWKISLSQLSLFKNGGGHPSGYLRVCHGKIHHAIKNGQPSISIRAIEKPWQTVGHNQRVPWSSMVYLNCRVGMIHPWRPWGVCSNPEPTEPTQLEWPAHRLPGSFQQIGPRWPSRLGQLIFRGFTHIKATSDWSMFIYDFSTDNLWFSIDLWFSHWWPMIIEESFLMISLWPMAPWHHGIRHLRHLRLTRGELQLQAAQLWFGLGKVGIQWFQWLLGKDLSAVWLYPCKKCELHRGNNRRMPVVPRKAVAEISKIGNL